MRSPQIKRCASLQTVSKMIFCIGGRADPDGSAPFPSAAGIIISLTSCGARSTTEVSARTLAYAPASCAPFCVMDHCYALIVHRLATFQACNFDTFDCSFERCIASHSPLVLPLYIPNPNHQVGGRIVTLAASCATSWPTDDS